MGIAVLVKTNEGIITMESLFDSIENLIKTYTAALPTSVIAVVLVVVGLKLGKLILKLIGLALIILAVFFYIKKV